MSSFYKNLKSENKKISLFGTPTFALMVDGKPEDISAFRPDPRGTLKKNKEYECLCFYDRQKRLIKIDYSSPKGLIEFIKVR